MERLVGSRTLTDLKRRILPAGLRDVQEWTDVTLTFSRRNENTGEPVIVVETPVVSISIAGGQSLVALGGVETTTRGSLKILITDVEHSPLHIEPGDRFNWDGDICIVDLVHPVKLDTYFTVEFTLLEE